MQVKNIAVDQNLKELTPHRTVVLPLACYNTTISEHINGYIPLHWHDEIQFVLVVKGEAVLQINEERIAVREGDGLFIFISYDVYSKQLDKARHQFIFLYALLIPNKKGTSSPKVPSIWKSMLLFYYLYF